MASRWMPSYETPGDCASVVTLHHDRLSERSYLFTMSDITCLQEASRLADGHELNFSANELDRPPGGARRDRTDDLMLAKHALSQLSYGPISGKARGQVEAMVGLGRLELPTSRLSSARSNQLSYKPGPGTSDQKPAIRKSHVASDY